MHSTGSNLLYSIFSYTEESLWSKVITNEGVMPSSFKVEICSFVVGQPSRIHPLILQSGFSNLVFTRSMINSLGTINWWSYQSEILTRLASWKTLSKIICLDGVCLISDQRFYHVRNLHILQLVLVSEAFRMICFSTARWPHQQDPWWAARALRPVQLKYADYLLKDDALGSVPIELYDLPLASLLHSLNLTSRELVPQSKLTV